jgi:hypothetical protein
MKENNPIATDARHAERLRKLGPGPHICLFCGLADPLALIPKSFRWLKNRVHRTVLESHHVLSRNHDETLTVLLCVLCHFMVTEGYLQAGIELHRESDPQRRIALMLRAQATFLRQLAERNCQWAALLSTSNTNDSCDGT